MLVFSCNSRSIDHYVSSHATHRSVRLEPRSTKKKKQPNGTNLAAVCGRSLSGFVGSNPAGGMDVCLL
jgi:hypothetical protein